MRFSPLLCLTGAIAILLVAACPLRAEAPVAVSTTPDNSATAAKEATPAVTATEDSDAWLARLRAAMHPQPHHTVADLKKLADAKLGEQLILAYIESSQTTFDPTAEDLLTLREAGLSEPALIALLKHDQTVAAKPAPAPIIQPAPQAVSQPAPVLTAPQPVVVAAAPVVVSAPVTASVVEPASWTPNVIYPVTSYSYPHYLPFSDAYYWSRGYPSRNRSGYASSRCFGPTIGFHVGYGRSGSWSGRSGRHCW